MIPQNNKNEKALSEINIQFINAIRELKISSLLKQSNICKDSRSRNGSSGEKCTAFEVFQFLLLFVCLILYLSYPFFSLQIVYHNVCFI